LPTFDLPMKAYSGLSAGGHCSTFAELVIYSDVLIFINEIFEIINRVLYKLTDAGLFSHHEYL